MKLLSFARVARCKFDTHHAWARELFDPLPCPWWTCEGALAERCVIYATANRRPAALELLEREIIAVRSDLESSLDRVFSPTKKYADTPVDFVDACMVSMTEARRDRQFITVDSDFRVCRRFAQPAIPPIMPSKQPRRRTAHRLHDTESRVEIPPCPRTTIQTRSASSPRPTPRPRRRSG